MYLLGNINCKYVLEMFKVITLHLIHISKYTNKSIHWTACTSIYCILGKWKVKKKNSLKPVYDKIFTTKKFKSGAKHFI